MKFLKGGGYSDPDFPSIVYCIPDLGSVELVVVYILFPSFNSLYMSFRMCWAGLLQVGCD